MDLNVDIGTLVKGLFGGKKDSGSNAGPPPNPHLRSIIVGAVLAGLVGAYLYFFYLPEQKRIQEMQALINSISEIRQETIELQRQILEKTAELDAGNARFDELNRLFHDKQELEDLYRNISLLALTYELLVAKLDKGKEQPVFSDKPAIDQGEGLEPKREVAFYKISVGFEFIGNYLGYTNFRRDLAKSKKIINIERERITVLPPDNDKGGQGVVAISATLSTFRFPNSDAERYVTGG